MEIKNIKQVYNGHFKIDLITLEGKNNSIIYRECVMKRSAVAGVVYNTKTEKYIFVKQYRSGTGYDILEIPAGLLDIPGEETEECMKREVLEETGYKVDKIEFLNEHFTSPGYSNEKIHLFYCEVSEKISNKLGVEDEEIELLEFDEDELKEIIFEDGKTILCLELIKNKI